MSSYDSFNNQNVKPISNSRIIPNAHDDLKTTLSKIEPGSPNIQNSPSKYGPPRWEQNHRHDRLGSKLDLKYSITSSTDLTVDQSPRNSREMDKDVGSSMEQMHQRMPERDRLDIYR